MIVNRPKLKLVLTISIKVFQIDSIRFFDRQSNIWYFTKTSLKFSFHNREEIHRYRTRQIDQQSLDHKFFTIQEFVDKWSIYENLNTLSTLSTKNSKFYRPDHDQYDSFSTVPFSRTKRIRLFDQFHAIKQNSRGKSYPPRGTAAPPPGITRRLQLIGIVVASRRSRWTRTKQQVAVLSSGLTRLAPR